MGAVYKVNHLDINRTIALKVLHNIHLDDDDSLNRFRREAKALCRLQHKNIVSFYNYGISKSGMPFMALEYLRGASLGSVLSNTDALPPERAMIIMLQICEGLSYAHSCGFYHRDMKPQNVILVTAPEDDTVKIVDFGLAKLTANSGILTGKLTKTGLLVGTVHYMSPEQVTGQPVDERSDVYACGCILFEMVTGQKPFDADTPMGLLYKHSNEDVPAFSSTAHGKNCPEAIEFICRKAMEKQPSRRYQNMDEMASDIKAALTGAGTLIANSRLPLTPLANSRTNHPNSKAKQKPEKPRSAHSNTLIRSARTFLNLLGSIKNFAFPGPEKPRSAGWYLGLLGFVLLFVLPDLFIPFESVFIKIVLIFGLMILSAIILLSTFLWNAISEKQVFHNLMRKAHDAILLFAALLIGEFALYCFAQTQHMGHIPMYVKLPDSSTKLTADQAQLRREAKRKKLNKELSELRDKNRAETEKYSAEESNMAPQNSTTPSKKVSTFNFNELKKHSEIMLRNEVRLNNSAEVLSNELDASLKSSSVTSHFDSASCKRIQLKNFKYIEIEYTPEKSVDVIGHDRDACRITGEWLRVDAPNQSLKIRMNYGILQIFCTSTPSGIVAIKDVKGDYLRMEVSGCAVIADGEVNEANITVRPGSILSLRKLKIKKLTSIGVAGPSHSLITADGSLVVSDLGGNGCLLNLGNATTSASGEVIVGPLISN